MNVVGVGTDLVEIERFRLAVQRRTRLPERLFSDDERAYALRHRDPVPRLAARFAAKEAVAKALGAPGGLHWQDAEVVTADSGEPSLTIKGSVAERAAELGIKVWHVSLSHDAGIASAVVVAEGEDQ
jgi:holo-[acyl-carrier protein] synthase